MNLGFPAPTPMALAVMGACFVVFLIQCAAPTVTDLGAFTFADHLAWTQPWRWITYQYLHGGAAHIFWNLLGIYFFLPPLERLWGWKSAFAFYTVGGIAAGITFGIITVFAHQFGILIGASGCIMACIGAVALLFPDMGIWLIVITIPIRAVAILIALWYALTVVAGHDLSNAAHLGGLAFGFLAPYFGRPMVQRFQRRAHRVRLKRRIDQERSDERLVDRILQKVHDTGMNSLTRWERRALKRATERQRLAEVARTRRGY
ncbi:MAG TPA: rhomboid family intramembrane serine protease [Tepidisphaeraceae bacterium]|nr:rhomboid family intramembrane serine protease [Tepidisphaeraceae bacterium]